VNHESEARAVARLGYELRLEVAFREEQFLMEVGIECHVAGEL